MPIDLRLDPSELPLLVDLYELTMAASFFEHGLNDTATFSLAMRRMPDHRGFMVAAGLGRLLEALEEFHFAADALEYLASLQLFKPEFLDFLAQLRFTGSVRALAEGTIFFAEEPLAEFHGPLIETQLIETLAINQIGFASTVASKAARINLAAGGRRLIDFGLRRAHGADAGLIAARSSYLAGFDGSSNVLAGRRYGIPVFGTMAHSYVMAHEREPEAFANFVRSFPQLSTLLVDTYDTVRGVQNAVKIGLQLKDQGIRLQAVRLDSGEPADLSRRARDLLDRAGLRETAIFVSGNLDEYRIADLMKSGAPIDAFGVGTALATSADALAPAATAEFTYKLVEYRDRPRIKTSIGKLSIPGRKQVFRASNQAGVFYADLIGSADESATTVAREFRPPPAQVNELLALRFEAGRRIAPPPLGESREYLRQSLTHLDPRHKALRSPLVYPVRPTAALNATMLSEKVRTDRKQE
jgi:nicotinate phosphoribosyltransferase